MPTSSTPGGHFFFSRRAVRSGLAFSLNPLDPARGIFGEAIRRAKAVAGRSA